YQAQIINKASWTELAYEKPNFTIDEAILDEVSAAKRPIVWLGNGAIQANAKEEVRALVDRLGAAVLTSEAAKGIYPENAPLCIGNFAATDEVADLLEKADALISVGVHFRGSETMEWTLPMPENHLHIDADPHAVHRSYEAKHTIVGDAKDVLGKLNTQLQNKSVGSDPAYQEEVKAVKEKVRENLRAQIGPYADIAETINQKLTKDSVLVTDVTIPGYTWG